MVIDSKVNRDAMIPSPSPVLSLVHGQGNLIKTESWIRTLVKNEMKIEAASDS